MNESSPAHDSSASDAELIARYRAGDASAAAELYRRHFEPARRLGVKIAGRSQGEDLAAEAMIRVLVALQRGAGPEATFRAYLMTTVRNTFANAVRRDRRYVWVDDHDTLGDVPETDDDLGLRDESSLLAVAFRSLPERWQVVLWHTTIERESNEAVATILGISAGAVGALAFRAREGLREAYLALHVETSADAACHAVREQLPAFSRGRLGAAEADVQEHLDGCAACSVALTDLRGVRGGLGVQVAPVLLGVAATEGLVPGAGPISGDWLASVTLLRAPLEAVGTLASAVATPGTSGGIGGALVAASVVVAMSITGGGSPEGATTATPSPQAPSLEQRPTPDAPTPDDGTPQARPGPGEGVADVPGSPFLTPRAPAPLEQAPADDLRGPSDPLVTAPPGPLVPETPLPDTAIGDPSDPIPEPDTPVDPDVEPGVDGPEINPGVEDPDLDPDVEDPSPEPGTDP